jgi:hypothetical protein
MVNIKNYGNLSKKIKKFLAKFSINLVNFKIFFETNNQRHYQKLRKNFKNY